MTECAGCGNKQVDVTMISLVHPISKILMGVYVCETCIVRWLDRIQTNKAAPSIYTGRS